MPIYDGIEDTYTALADALGTRKIAYVHIMDQSGFENIKGATAESMADKMLGLVRVMREKLPHTALILTGGMTRDRAEALIAEGLIDLAGFGKMYISNPDLVARLRNDRPLAPPDTTTFYGGDAHGYVDYPPYLDA
jgi:2,4-dienoyl-CoA reductase-like NADH-dependent reductase (Old Yellow Enzyme family)